MKARGEKIPALTTYDYPTTRILDEAGVPLLLVGDSLGMVVLGYPDTTHVTMEEMEHHVRAAARAKPRGLLAADLPFRAYDTVEMALANAGRLVAAGAEAVKAEGGVEIQDQVRAIVGAGIPFIGHLGMLPQHVLEEGGYHVKGKIEAGEAKTFCGCPGARRCGRVLHRAGTRHRAGGARVDGSASGADDRHRLRAALRRPDPGDAGFDWHVSLGYPETRSTEGQRGGADSRRRAGMDERDSKPRVEGRGSRLTRRILI